MAPSLTSRHQWVTPNGTVCSKNTAIRLEDVRQADSAFLNVTSLEAIGWELAYPNESLERMTNVLAIVCERSLGYCDEKEDIQLRDTLLTLLHGLSVDSTHFDNVVSQIGISRSFDRMKSAGVFDLDNHESPLQSMTDRQLWRFTVELFDLADTIAVLREDVEQKMKEVDPLWNTRASRSWPVEPSEIVRILALLP